MAGELNLFENNPLPAWICEPQTLHVIQVNKAAVRAFGYTRATWLKGTLSDLITGKLNTHNNAPVAGTIAHNDGRTLAIQLCTSIVTMAEQKMILVTGYDFSVERSETVKVDNAANKAVEEEAKKLALVTSHISNGVILTDREGKITWVNAGFERITEYKPAEVVGKKPGSFLQGPETDSSTVSYMHNCFLRMEGFRTEILNYSKNGRKYWVDIDVMPIKGESGEVNGFMAIMSDITVLKTAVQEMLKSENLLQTIMDNAPILVFLKDLEGRYTFFNKTFTKFHPGDYSRKVITDNDLFNQDEAAHFQSTDRHIIQTRETLELEQDVVQNGKTDSFYTIKFPLMDDKKNVYAVGGIALRITERKQAEQDRKKLESEQARLDKIVRESYNEIYLFNWESLRFEFANASALRNIGYSHEELITCKFSDLFSYPDEMALQVLLGPLRRGETDRLQLQIKHSRKDGTYYDVDTLIQVLEKQQSFVAIATDITQKLVTEKKLLATILEKETLIKEIHHRVKNNLQLISSIIYIKMASLKEPEIRYFLQNTRQKIRTISLIHERLLQSETLDKVEISDYLGKLMYDLQTTNARQDLALEIKTNIQEIIIDLDTAIYCGLIANELITNAIKHAFKGRSAGVIEVLFKQVQEDFLLSVSDNGITMPLSVEPGKSGSFGMQLLEIFARQLGGTIEIIREKGTKFQIRF